MNWTRPVDARAQIEKLWVRGSLLASLAANTSLFPMRLSFRTPTASDMVTHFDAVRAWIRDINTLRFCRIETRNFRHRELGNNAVPAELWIDRFDDAVALIGKQAQAAQFAAVMDATMRHQPAWVAWLARKPLQVLALAPDWERFLAIAAWCQAHPRPGIYLRQMDLPGVHTKFIEAHRAPLAELLDLVLAPETIDPGKSGAGRFTARYGFRDKPERIRFRILDPSRMPAWPGDDITITAAAFAQLDPPLKTVFITENEINFLAFPPTRDSLVIFGSGYGFAFLHQAQWLTRCRIHYWGDIDTHGFAILDQLRHGFDHLASFLMNSETLFTFKHLWGIEPTPTKRDLTMLTAGEQALYDEIRNNRITENLRLEQEKIGFGWIRQAVAAL